MIRYAIYDVATNGYVGHRTNCYDHSKSLPPHMITRNYPCVDYDCAKLYLRKSDAEKLLKTLNEEFYNRFSLKEFVCYPKETEIIKNKQIFM